MIQDNKEKYINPPEERRGYEDSVKAYRDINNAINTAKAEAKVEANTESARKMKAKGFATEIIAEITGLSKEEIEPL